MGASSAVPGRGCIPPQEPAAGGLEPIAGGCSRSPGAGSLGGGRGGAGSCCRGLDPFGGGWIPWVCVCVCVDPIAGRWNLLPWLDPIAGGCIPLQGAGSSCWGLDPLGWGGWIPWEVAGSRCGGLDLIAGAGRSCRGWIIPRRGLDPFGGGWISLCVAGAAAGARKGLDPPLKGAGSRCRKLDPVRRRAGSHYVPGVHLQEPEEGWIPLLGLDPPCWGWILLQRRGLILLQGAGSLCVYGVQL